MGREEPRAQRHRRPSDPLVLPLVLLVLLPPLLGPVGGAQRPHDQRLLDVRSSIVEALGLAGIPDVAKANVSQAEYERAHNEYLSKLQRKRGGAHRRSLSALRPSSIEAGDGETAPVSLSFPPGGGGDRCGLESALLRLLLQPRERDGDPEQELELRVYGEAPDGRGGGRALARLGLRGLAPGRPRWLQLELPAAELRRRRPLRLRAQLVAAAAAGGWTARGLRVSEAALNLHLACARGPVGRARRSARRASGVGELWSVHRGRRSECKVAAGPGAKRCCRHEMSVNFKELEGFEFIVQPKSFDAGFCKGRCPPRYNPAHHHALLQSLIWKGDRSKAPRPCCAPSKLAELEILYFDESEPTKLKVSNWKDMRVLECACS